MDKDLFVMIEMQQDREELYNYGLSEEEIEGYFDFFIDNFFPNWSEKQEVEQ